MEVGKLVEAITNAIINPLIALLFSAGLLVFVWGLVQFLMGVNEESDKKEDGKRHMLWGVVGMFIMVAAGAIINVVANTFSLPYRV